MRKWKLMLSTLPFPVAVLAVKLLLQFGLKWPGFVEFGDIGIVLTAGVFLTGFMLGGTLADYKESEKLPGELASLLETLEEFAVQGARSKPNLAVAPLRAGVLVMTDAIHGWLLKRKTQDEAYASLEAFSKQLTQLERDGAGGYASKALGEVHNLRKVVTRIGVISRTGFLPPAYALLDTLVVLILVLVLSASYKSLLAMCILVPFITLIYVYMVRLIRDIDDPFEYAPDGSMVGGAEVELFPLTEFRERLVKRQAAE